MRLRIFQKTALILICMAILPLTALTLLTLFTAKNQITHEVERGLILKANDIAQQVSDLLNNTASDLLLLEGIPKTAESLLHFSESRRGPIWTRVGTNQDYTEVKISIPLYREIAFIDKKGFEKIKIENVLDETGLPQKRYRIITTVASPEQLKNVTLPQNTLFKMEDYFMRAKNLKQGAIYAGHLTGWYVSAKEQLQNADMPEHAIEGKRYEGILRFAAPIFNPQGEWEGVITLALDQTHLQEKILHVHPLQEKPVLIAPYSGGNYCFLFDDEGWIVAHQKLWDIRGLTPDGIPYEPFKNIQGTNKGPVQLTSAPEIRNIDEHKIMMEKIRNHESHIFRSPNIGLDKKPPLLRTQGYAPILFDKGDYQKEGIFGGVMVGAEMSAVGFLAKQLSKDYWLLLALTLALVLPMAAIIARSLTRRLNTLSAAAAFLAEGDWNTVVPCTGDDEIGQLETAFNRMTERLKRQQEQLEEKEKKERLHLKSRIDLLEKELAQMPLEGLVIESQSMKELLKKVRQLAQTDIPVLILGERGTGKEKIAATLHNSSPRKSGPTLHINCAAISENLMESELFGHAKGAFTGAFRDKVGFFEAANGGTLLLDEIGEIPLNLQAKLLRVLQEKRITRVGETTERPVDTRLVFATNQDLNDLVLKKMFRADLYDRLHVVTLMIPPLREHREDIIPLAKYFLQQATVRYNKNLIGFSNEAIDFLMQYSWPGNVRELEHAIERAVIQTETDFIEKATFEPHPAGDFGNTTGNFSLPDMKIEDLKIRYARHIRGKYPEKPLKEIKEILGIDWNTLRKYLAD